jgi:methylglyoxal synthase
MGIDVEKAASVAAASAVKAAYKINEETGVKVKNAASGPIGGVKILLDSTFVNEKNSIDIER